MASRHKNPTALLMLLLCVPFIFLKEPSGAILWFIMIRRVNNAVLVPRRLGSINTLGMSIKKYVSSELVLSDASFR